ncbi:hypothetical protein F8271_25955 [Micromonospora sp. ALFpr18c]|nr:hypothetical protein F8271_25955 [Micromonospora sp. ALFpr18c]
MTVDLSPQQYRELLGSALPIAADADTLDPNLRTLFTPSSHRLALEPEVTVVRGARGVGKTVWFKALQNQLLRRVAADAYKLPRLTRIETHPVFGSELAPDRYPGPAILADLADRVSDPMQIWMAVLLYALKIDEVTRLSTWAARVAWVRENPEPVERSLSAADRAATDAGVTHLLLFDALERLHPDRSRTDLLVAGILRLALDLRTRTRSLRGKVFIRHDMFESGRLHFADASKLLSNAADLTWAESSLYGLLFHHLGNAENEHARAFRQIRPGWREQEIEPGEALRRFVPPSELTGDRKTQQELFVRIAGRYMGTDHRKGHTYTWLPNHLMDGLSQVSPRSFLRALTKAVEVTEMQYAGHVLALHYEGIRRGVQEASRTRVAEITEDLRWVELAIAPLEGLQVPAELETIIERWGERSLGSMLTEQADEIDLRNDPAKVRTGPRNPRNYQDLVEELVGLGVMTKRANGRIDLPDVYRIAFNIGRRGGVPRLKASS